MTPDDRLAAILWLIAAAVATTTLMLLVDLVFDVLEQVPVVTKDPLTGQLYIPRSNLYVGQRTRRHHDM